MKKQQKYTVIEVLVVTAIIAVLVSISVSKVSSMQMRAKITKVNADLSSINAAIVNYSNEYGELPYTGNDYPTSDQMTNFSEILPILRGDNKRGINFLSADLSSSFQVGDAKDYSNYSYQIALDYDHNGVIDTGVMAGSTYPSISEDLLASAAVWMKSPNEGNSDIYSWLSLGLYDANLSSATGEVGGVSPDSGDLITENSYVASDTNVVGNGKNKPKSNNGHGNNVDGVDSSNPGNSKQGEDTDPTVDDEAGGGSCNKNNGKGNNK